MGPLFFCKTALFLGQKWGLIRGIICKLLMLCGLDDMKKGHRDDAAGNGLITPAGPKVLTAESEITAEDAEPRRKGRGKNF